MKRILIYTIILSIAYSCNKTNEKLLFEKVNYARKVVSSAPTTTIKICDSIVNLKFIENHPEVKYYALNTKARGLFNQKKYNESIDHLKSYENDTMSDIRKVNFHIILALSYDQINENIKSANEYNKSIKIFRRNSSPRGEFRMLSAMMRIYNRENMNFMYYKSLEHAESLYKFIPNENLFYHLYNIAFHHLMNSNIDKAYNYLEKCREVMDSTITDSDKGYFYLNLGETLHSRNEPLKARDTLYKSSEYLKKCNDKRGLRLCNFYLASINSVISPNTENLTILDSIYKSLKSEELHDYVVTRYINTLSKTKQYKKLESYLIKTVQDTNKTLAYKYLADFYKNQKKKDLEEKYFRMFNILRDSIQYNELSIEQNEYKSYLIQRQNETINKSTKSKSIFLKKKLSNQNKILLYLIICIILLLISIAIIIVGIKRTKNKHKIILKLNNFKSKTFSVYKTVDQKKLKNLRVITSTLYNNRSHIENNERYKMTKELSELSKEIMSELEIQ